MLSRRFSFFNPFDRFGNTFLSYEKYQFKKKIRKYYSKGVEPNAVILQWTQVGFLLPYLKKFFPNSKYVIIEEDVMFLNYSRRIQLQNTEWGKWIAKWRYNNIKKQELKILGETDWVVTNNLKDTALLIEEKIESEKIFNSTVFFEDYFNIINKPQGKDVLFYGAMNREENYLSVIWFIENVLYELSDKNIRLIVVGGNPNKKLREYEGERVIITGFVDDVSTYFERCFCMVAPLVLGAGIKIKVLEAMSAGIPVLTNKIGIEGIPAINKKHYFYCENPIDYVTYIEEILVKKRDVELLGREAKQFIQDNYNIKQKVNQLYDLILKEG